MNIGDNIEHLVKPHEAELKAKDGVTGISSQLQPKFRRGKKMRGVRCLRIYVKRKKPVIALDFRDQIPKEIEGLPTDVFEADFQTQSWLWPFRKPAPQLFGPPGVYTKRQRPIRPGWSIGHEKVTAGTLGWFYWDSKNGYEVGSSNNHVAGWSNQAQPLDQILQPGRADGGRVDWDMAAWLIGFVPLLTDGDNFTDKAWFAIETFTGHYIAPEGYGPPRGKREAEVGLECLKVGRTTGKTKAVIFDASAYIQVGFGSLGNLWFRDTFIAHKMSEGGDSGSPAFTADMMALGTLFAGSSAFSVFVKERYTPPHLELLGGL